MTTTGAVDVNLDNIGDAINSSTQLAERVIGGVADQGDLIGLGIGIALAIVFLFGAIFIVIGVIPRLIGKLKGLRQV